MSKGQVCELDIDFYAVERAFLEALADAGIPPADGEHLKLDGTKHLYTVAGDKKKRRGEYCVYVDESPAGYFLKYGGSSAVPYTGWSFKSGFLIRLLTRSAAPMLKKSVLSTKQDNVKKQAIRRGQSEVRAGNGRRLLRQMLHTGMPCGRGLRRCLARVFMEMIL
ncbi:MAG: hypothetical protein RRY12_12720 [Cloacibacillus sp.]